jgi:catechol 2,3-dioxygenase-like lactoylglutathione lyase family enzyme
MFVSAVCSECSRAVLGRFRDMLGRFLELSLPTPDVRASLEFYLKLGFAQAEVGEAWPHAYAVVTDGRICLGLHEAGAAELSLTFVKPGLLRHLPALEALGVEFESRRLGNDVFNEVGWQDPAGHRIRLVEARTFSPAATLATADSACGYFLEVALPEAGLEAAKEFWERFGFVGMDDSDKRLPHVCCTSDSIDIGLHDPARIGRPSLLFDAQQPEQCIATLAGRGIEASQVPASLRDTGARLIVAPEGTPILIVNMS